jgi:DNA polymerase III sliding clamp (beta) subunit (PCNA family)
VLLQKALRFVTDPVQLVKRDLTVILNDTFSLPGLDPVDFPGSPAQAAHAVIGEPFAIPARWVDLLPAASQDQSRLNLSGVCIDLTAGYCVSSDGHRLHTLRIPSVIGGTRGIVPFPAAKLLARLLPKGSVHGQFSTQRPVLTTEQTELLALTLSDETPGAVRRRREVLEQELQQPKLLQFRVPGVELWTRLIEGEFPEYGSLLQRSTECTSVLMPRVPLLEALQACVACAPKRNLGISLMRVPTGIRIRLEATEHGAVERVIACQGWQLGCAIGMNAQYLLHAVSCLRGNEVTLQLTDATASVHMEDHELRIVIMPMRILESAEQPPAIPAATRSTTVAVSPDVAQP